MSNELYETRGSMGQKSPGTIDPYGPYRTRSNHDIEFQGVFQLITLMGMFWMLILVVY